MSAIIYKDIVPVDMSKPLRRDNVGVLLGGDDSQANIFGVTIEGVTSLSDCTMVGYFIRPWEDDTILLTGTIDGNKASVTLPQECYEQNGSFTLALKLCATGGVASTVRIVDGYIRQTRTDSIIDPGDAIPNLEELLTQVSSLREATAEAESVTMRNNGLRKEIPGSAKYVDSDGVTHVDLNLLTEPGYFLIPSNYAVDNIPAAMTSAPWFVHNEKFRYLEDDQIKFVKQQVYNRYLTESFARVTNASAVFEGWVDQTNEAVKAALESLRESVDAAHAMNNGYRKLIPGEATSVIDGVTHVDLNLLTEPGYFLIPSNYAVDNIPAAMTSAPWFVHNEKFRYLEDDQIKFVKQQVYNRYLTESFARVTNASEIFEPWVDQAAGQSVNYNNTYVTQEISATVTPTIQTSTDNYLASTNDENDRAADIMAMLQTTGVCKLGPGMFYVSGVTLPEGSCLEGCGNASQIILIATVTDGQAIKTGSYCTIRNLQINGLMPYASVSANIGTRHGIMHSGTYDDPDNPTTTGNVIISDVRINGFNGGGITGYNTGTSTQNGINAANCVITKCNVGIYIKYYSEYHRFTNILMRSCYYGCINDGGNNLFSNCGFSTNKVGFLMDNSDGSKLNDGHGSVSCCTFNHTDSNNGVGIKIIGCDAGFIFTGCQVYYSDIVLEDSQGVVFDALNLGADIDISATGGGAILFTNCVFSSAPTRDVTANTHFINCYAKDGTAIT